MSGERGRDQDQMDGAALTMPEIIRQLRAIADALAAKDINVPIYDEEEIYPQLHRPGLEEQQNRGGQHRMVEGERR